MTFSPIAPVLYPASALMEAGQGGHMRERRTPRSHKVAVSHSQASPGLAHDHVISPDPS